MTTTRAYYSHRPLVERTLFRFFDYLEQCGVLHRDMTHAEVFTGLLKVLWVALSFILLGALLASGSITRNLLIVASATPLMLLQNIGVIAITITVAVLLAQIKPLQFSWLSLLPGDQEATNAHVAPIHIPWWGVFYGLLLLLNVPSLALAEEQVFRLGVVEWTAACKWALIFGLVHCIVGVPLCAGLALAIPGLWFHYQCFQGGITLSTAHHTVYNLIILTPMLIGAVLRSFGSGPDKKNR